VLGHRGNNDQQEDRYPNRSLDDMKTNEGDFIMFCEDDDGKIIVKKEGG